MNPELVRLGMTENNGSPLPPLPSDSPPSRVTEVLCRDWGELRKEDMIEGRAFKLAKVVSQKMKLNDLNSFFELVEEIKKNL